MRPIVTRNDTAVGGPSGAAARWRAKPSPVLLVALAVGLLVTAALAWSAAAVYSRNEGRLLELRARELGLVFAGAVTNLQTPLASAVELADATDGSAAKFRSFMTPYVGNGKQFTSVSLLPLGASQPTVVVGAKPVLLASPVAAQRFFARAERTPLLEVTRMILGSVNRRLGYEYNTPGVKAGFAVYAETALPADRRSKLTADSGFSDLNYALYLGPTQRPQQLLVTNIGRFPISGRKASESVPFGDSSFTLVITPDGSLGGSFFEQLPWIIAAFGIVLSLAAAAVADRLSSRRRHAEQLAADLDQVAEENRRMYAEQRGIAQTLQHALLPEAFPSFAGLQTSARYIPETSGIEVGGDWFDLVEVDAQRGLLIVGDVSGHGLRVATTMASLRFAALAFVSQDPNPGAVLASLADFVDREPHAYFATVLCCLIEVDAHRLTLASAGHLAPLLVDGNTGVFPEMSVGVPIGVERDAPYDELTVEVARGATLLAFTDGLVERRGEILDVGLERLRAAATAQRLALDDLVEKLAHDLGVEAHRDDTAIVAVRWDD